MKNFNKLMTLAIFSLLFISTLRSQSGTKEYLSVGKKIEFNGETFELKWSSHPSEVYYKQEYLRKDDELPKYEKMIMVEAVKANIPSINAAIGKINELENWKERNPIVRYKKFENKEKNEVILEFLVSDGNSVYEWNIYRYKNENNNSGKYLVLYSYSYRNYIATEKDKNKFLSEINEIENQFDRKG